MSTFDRDNQLRGGGVPMESRELCMTPVYACVSNSGTKRSWYSYSQVSFNQHLSSGLMFNSQPRERTTPFLVVAQNRFRHPFCHLTAVV